MEAAMRRVDTVRYSLPLLLLHPSSPLYSYHPSIIIIIQLFHHHPSSSIITISFSLPSLPSSLPYVLLGNLLEITTQFTKADLDKHRDDVIQTMMLFVNNSNPRVRYTAYYSLSQFFVNHGKELDKNNVEIVLSNVLHALDTNTNPSPRVRRMILICLIKMINIINTSILEERVGIILTTIASTLAVGPTMVQELCVSAIIGLAECIKGDHIGAYYDSLMPILHQLLVHSQSINDESLWGQGLECCALGNYYYYYYYY